MRWPNLRAPAFAVVLPILSFAAGAASPQPPAPADIVLHPDLEISLFAMEPDVVDPVALTFDESGRMYVVEMRDYPYGFGPERKPGGTVRLLEDVDGNGRADLSTVFAEDLSFPTSVAAWNGGVLVAAPPEILFLKDTDGDGRADVREVVFRGFHLGVTDGNFNGLRWGLDNWLHGCNGGAGGTVTSPRRTGAAPLDLGNRDFRVRPATGEIELTTHTGGGFGIVFDDWGRSFTTHNINHIQQRVADADSFARFPGLPPFRTTHSISDHGDMARIYPISVAQTRPNHPEQAGHFSSAGGVGYIGHLGWPKALQGSVLICDVVGNLVHRDVLVQNGPVVQARRAPENQASEFLASRDNAFRPVGLEPGPDGALYLLDMQREVIEHPDYIPPKMLEKVDIRAGSDRGRIYRILPKDRAALARSVQAAGTADPRRPAAELLPGRATPAQWVQLLNSPNPWTRQTAQRLLVAGGERETDDALVTALRDLASRPDPRGGPTRLHALHVLDGLGQLEAADLLPALSDPNPRVRAAALVLTEGRHGESPALRARLAEAASDPDAEVRFRAALAAGSPSGGMTDYVVFRVLTGDRQHAWSRRAALSSLRRTDWFLPHRIAVSSEAIARPDEWTNVVAETYALLGARLATNQVSLLEAALRRVATLPRPELQAASLDGLREGLERSQVRLVATDGIAAVLAGFTQPPAVLAAAWRLAQRLGLPPTPQQTEAQSKAMRQAVDPGRPLSERLDAIALLALGELPAVAPTLFALLDGRQPSAVQRAAFSILRTHREPEVATGLIRAWPALTPALRPETVNLLVYRHAFHDALLDALEDGRLEVGPLNLDLEHRRQLLRRATAENRQRASRFMTDDEYSNRKSLVDEWLARLPATGNAELGRPVFERACAQCHRAGSLGSNVGPELTGVRHRSVEDLLSNTLDPNMAMNPIYVAFTAELDDGEQETGILAAENAESVTLLQASERRVVIPRTRLRQLKSDGRSLMPEGLEAGLTPADLRNLIAFLQDSDTSPATGGSQ